MFGHAQIAIAYLLVSIYKLHMYEELASIVKAAKIAGVHRATIFRWIRQGILPTVKISGHTFIRVDDLNELKRPRRGRPPKK
jgi:transposase-like protein